MRKTMLHNSPDTYTVLANIPETQDTTTLELFPTNGVLRPFCAGQYLTIYFPELHTPEGKAYSISSSPTENVIRITVKSIGTFSKRLCSLNPGDILTASSPYGYFYSEEETKDLILIAGGIGVAPFRSMIIDSLLKNQTRKHILFYSVKTTKDLVFKNEFNFLEKTYSNFSIHHFITREQPVPEGMIAGRITGQKILDHTPTPTNSEFFICGSISFTRDMWKSLKSLGVSEDSIYTEAFFS